MSVSGSRNRQLAAKIVLEELTYYQSTILADSLFQKETMQAVKAC